MTSLLRTGASRTFLRTLAQPRAAKTTTSFQTQLHTLSRRPQIAAPKSLALTRWQSSRQPIDSVNEKREEKLSERILKATPDSVSSSSTILPTVGTENPRSGASEGEQDTKMMAGINSDLVCSKRACTKAAPPLGQDGHLLTVNSNSKPFVTRSP